MTNVLTEAQVEFILEKFFLPWTNQYPGAMNLGRTLLTEGTAIVAGVKCIFVGGIGNFIKTEDAEGYFDCLKYTFQMESFLTSLYFHEVLESNLESLAEEKSKIDSKIEELQTVFNYSKMLRNEADAK